MDQFLQDHVYSLVHWPFVAVTVICWLTGQVMSSMVWTKERAEKHWLWRWGRGTRPMHPVAAGMLLGLVWSDPEPAVQGVASIVYFGFAGACSTWAYDVLKALAKARGIELRELPGPN